MNGDTPAALGALRVDEGKLKSHVDEVVRSSVEETLNGLLDAEADHICQTQRYERSPERADSRAGHYERKLETKAGAAAFGQDAAHFSEQAICGANGLKPDFYFREEETIVEVALGLPNPSSEFEKDILKAIMAQELGMPVRLLFFISRAGASKKCSQPGRTAMREWALRNHNLAIEIHDLPGEPRKRTRKTRVR